MKSTLPKIIGATTLALGAQAAQGGEFIDQPIEITLTEKEIQELCAQTQNNSYAILNRREVCEISTDNGKTWMLLAAAVAAGLFGAGYSKRKKIQPCMVRFLNRKKPDKNIMDGPEPVVIEPRLLEELPISLIEPAEPKAGLVSRVKDILSKKSKPASPGLATVTITQQQLDSEIRKEYEKRMQEMKDAFDTGLSDQDAMRAFYLQADEMIKDMNYTFEERNQVRAWCRTIDLR